MATVARPPDPEINLGPLILGSIVDLLLFGVTCGQLSVYLTSSRSPRWQEKTLVLWAWTAGCASTGFGIHFVWGCFVQNFGAYSQLYILKHAALYPAFAAFTMLPVQLFYLERAYKLFRRQVWVLILVAPLMSGVIVGGAGCTVVLWRLSSRLDLIRLPIWFYLGDCGALAADCVLTGLILAGLWRNKTGWSHTDQLVKSLVRASVESQLPATLTAIGFLLTYAIKQDSQFLYFWLMQHAKVYIFSILAVLNFRVTAEPASRLATSDCDRTAISPGTKVYGHRTTQLDIYPPQPPRHAGREI